MRIELNEIESKARMAWIPNIAYTDYIDISIVKKKLTVNDKIDQGNILCCFLLRSSKKIIYDANIEMRKGKFEMVG